MISMVLPLSVGNALRLFLELPQGAVAWKVLRKGSDTFTGHDDSSAAVVYEGPEAVFVDTLALPNEQIAFYRLYHTLNGADWIASATAYGTPRAIYKEQTTDVQATLRERLEAGLKIEVERGNLMQQELGYIPVFTEYPAGEQDIRFPMVTIHLESEDSGERGIGEELAGDLFDELSNDWIESEGWLANVRITMVGWSLNSDERSELRKAIRRVVIANLPVFDAKGFQRIDLSQKEAFNDQFNAPLYQVMSDFSCLAPVVVAGTVDPIREVESQATAFSHKD